MDYIDLRLGDFLNNIVMMSDVEVYDTLDNSLLFTARIGGLHNFDIRDSILVDNADLNAYGIEYVSTANGVLEIYVTEI